MESVGIVGRKANSSSAVDKLKKKKKKKRRSKDGKRSSISGGSSTRSPESDGRIQPQKSRSSLSCPPEINPQSSRKPSDASPEVSFNETLRWLPFIAKHSPAVPPTTSNTRLHGPTVSRLNSNSLTENPDEEEERIAIYKMNRRKRYLAAQQAILDLYPDTKVYATDEASRSDLRRLPNKTPIFPNTDPLDPTKSANTFELALPSFANHKDKIMTQKVL